MKVEEKEDNKVHKFKSIDGKYIIFTGVNPKGDLFDKYFKPLKEKEDTTP